MNYTMQCPRCNDGTISIHTESEYHPEYPGGAWEPEAIVEIEPDCNCWDTGETMVMGGKTVGVLSAELWDIDISKAEVVT